MLSNGTSTIPKGSARSKLKNSGRILDLQIYRSLSSKETMDLIIDNFKEFDIKKIGYMRANRDNCLQAVHEELDACGVIQLAGSGSLYVNPLCSSASDSQKSSASEDISPPSATDPNHKQLLDQADEVLRKLEVFKEFYLHECIVAGYEYL